MIDFPASPTVGQTFTAAGVTWTWDGVKWGLTAAAGAPITVGDIPPSSPVIGALWYDSVGGQMYVFYADPNTSQWVPTTNQMGGGYATTAYVNSLPVIGDNRLINGDMRIDQRNNGASGTANNVYTADRWGYASNQASKATWQRIPTSAAPGFPYAFGFISSSAYASLAGDNFGFYQRMEADMVSDFQWGAANAQPVTLSFWAFSSLTGTFSGAIQNQPSPGTRSYPFTYQITAANTWQKFVIIIPGDTAGTWVMSGNAAGVMLIFDLGSGSTARGPANAWATTASPGYYGATGAVSVVGTNGATFYVTGVKLEVGSVATPFNRQSLAKSMADCQRYFSNTAVAYLNVSGIASTSFIQSITLPVTMRALPTLTFTNVSYINASGVFVALGSTTSTAIAATATATGNTAFNVTIIASAEL